MAGRNSVLRPESPSAGAIYRRRALNYRRWVRELSTAASRPRGPAPSTTLLARPAISGIRCSAKRKSNGRTCGGVVSGPRRPIHASIVGGIVREEGRRRRRGLYALNPAGGEHPHFPHLPRTLTQHDPTYASLRAGTGNRSAQETQAELQHKRVRHSNSSEHPVRLSTAKHTGSEELECARKQPGSREEFRL